MRLTVRREPPARLGLWALLLLCVFACAPGLAPQHWRTAQGFVPAWNVAQPATLANVAVAPDLWRGMGIGALLPAQPLRLLGIAPAVAAEWVLLSCLVLGALGVYGWLAPRLGDRAAGLAGAVYLLSPPLLTTVYVQGNLGAALLLALLPLALAGVAAFAVERTLRPAGAALPAAVALLAIVWMVRAQAGLAIVAVLLLALYAWLAERSRATLLLVIGAGVAALLSLIPAWGVRAGTAADFAAGFTSLYGLLRASATAAQPLQIGVAALVLSAAALFALLAVRSPAADPQRRLLIFCLAGAAALLALTLPWSAWLWRVTGAQRLLSAPWQIGLLAAPLLAAASGGALLYFGDLRRAPWLAATALAVLIAAQPYLAPIYTDLTPPDRPHAIIGNNEVAVLSARVDETPATGGTSRQATLTLTWQALAPLPFDANLFFQALDMAGATPRVVAQLDMSPVADQPANTWRPGDLFTQTYTIDIPVGVSDPLTYVVGLYNWRDGTRLAVNGGLDDKLILYGQ